MELAKVIHYYLGCKVLHRPYEGNPKEIVGRLVDITENGEPTVATKPLTNEPEWIISYSADVASGRFQPLLRKLEDMTEEEIGGMALAGGLIGTPTRANIEGNFIQLEYVKDSEILVEHWHPNELNAREFHYLLSRGFDLFGLIDSQQALNINSIQ